MCVELVWLHNVQQLLQAKPPPLWRRNMNKGFISHHTQLGWGILSPGCKSVLCSQGCFTPGLGPLPLRGCSRVGAARSEQGVNFGQPNAETSRGHRGWGCWQGWQSSGWCLGGTLVPPWGPWQGLVPNRRDQGMCHTEVKYCQGCEDRATALM